MTNNVIDQTRLEDWQSVDSLGDHHANDDPLAWTWTGKMTETYSLATPVILQNYIQGNMFLLLDVTFFSIGAH